jgi:hypothetical protein
MDRLSLVVGLGLIWWFQNKVDQDKKNRLQQLLKHPLIGEILHQAPNEITVLFYKAIDDNSNIDTYMLEYLESYTLKAK